MHFSGKISTATAFTLLALVLFWALAFIGDLTFISSKLVSTSELMADAMRQDSLGVTSGGNSFAMTARILNFFPSPINWWLNIILGSVAIVLFGKNIRSIVSIGVALMMVMPPIVLFMVRLLKESILIPALSVVGIVLASKMPKLHRLLILSSIYFAYGYYIRSYYLLIIGAFWAVYCFAKSNIYGRALIVLGALAAIVVLPTEVYYALQGGAHRGGSAMLYVRTAFANPFEGNEFWGFLGNYAYAAFRLNFPIFFTQSPLEIFHMVSIGCYGAVVWVGLRSAIWEHRIVSKLLIAHAMVLWLFEPDLGSYLRHPTSAFPFAGLVLREFVPKFSGAGAFAQRFSGSLGPHRVDLASASNSFRSKR